MHIFYSGGNMIYMNNERDIVRKAYKNIKGCDKAPNAGNKVRIAKIWHEMHTDY